MGFVCVNLCDNRLPVSGRFLGSLGGVPCSPLYTPARRGGSPAEIYYQALKNQSKSFGSQRAARVRARVRGVVVQLCLGLTIPTSAS